MSSKRLLIIAFVSVALAGCNTWYRHIGEEDAYFGEAQRYNTYAQVINPAPVYPEGSAEPGSNGDKMAQAVQRYRQDKVNARHTQEAESLNTQRSVTGGGAGPQ